MVDPDSVMVMVMVSRIAIAIINSGRRAEVDE